MPEVEDMTASEVATKFSAIMEALKSNLATRLLKLCVDEIEVKVQVLSTDEDGNPVIKPVRLVASSMEGVSGSRLVLSVRDLTQLLESPRNSAFSEMVLMRSALLTHMLLPMSFRLSVLSLVASVPRTLMISLDFLRLDSSDSGMNILPHLTM